MKTHLLLRTFSLLAAILISSCEVLAEGAPAVTTPSRAPAPTLASTSQPPTQASITATETQVPAEAPTQTPLAVATSRGPNLEATDPTTVQLDSGGLQLVEFFRFT